MRTGLVIEIKRGKAVIMESGGEFVEVPAKAQWKKGEIVSFRNRSPVHFQAFAAAAACFLIVGFSGTMGYSSYYEKSVVVSLDVNPSIELEANRFERVIGVTAFNDEGEEILDKNPIKNKKLDEAIEILFSGGLKDYVSEDAYVTLTVQSRDKKREGSLLAELEEAAAENVKSEDSPAKLEVYAVDEATVSNAHQHHVTAGKYVALQQLKEVMPQVDIREYSHCSIGEIRQQIAGCHSSPESEADESGEKENSGHSRHHRHHKNRQ